MLRDNLKFLTHAIIPLVALLSAGACSHTDKATPRPYAYPRIPLYDTIYRALPGLPLNLEVNTSTIADDSLVNTNGLRWITLSYPAYNAKFYITITPYSSTPELDKIIANRNDRMARNINTPYTRATTILSSPAPEYQTRLVQAMDNSPMPLQILTVGPRHVISGALHLANPYARLDSIRPMVDAVTADMIHLATNLR